MSLNAMHRNIMIFSDTQRKAEAKLDEMISELNEEILVRKPNFVKTPSKTIQATFFHQGCRGYRYREVYVDYSLAFTDAMDLILAKLVPPDYYIGYERDENYNRRDHVHYF